MVQKMIAADPDFPKKLQEFMKNQTQQAAVSAEQQEQEDAAKKFSVLE